LEDNRGSSFEFDDEGPASFDVPDHCMIGNIIHPRCRGIVGVDVEVVDPEAKDKLKLPSSSVLDSWTRVGCLQTKILASGIGVPSSQETTLPSWT